MHVLIIEPYYGGSHRGFVEVLERLSRHRIETMTLPPRFWKWRLSGAPFLFSERFRKLKETPDLLFFSNTIDVAAFVSLAGIRAARLPKVMYFHENQITYPISDHDSFDSHFGLINLTSAAACDEVWFNSEFHRNSFLAALGPFLGQFPDFHPQGVDDAIRKKSRVLPIPVDPLPEVKPALPKVGPMRILWNHRWEYDKAPDEFFAALDRLLVENIDFQVVLLGEGFRSRPPIFDRARQKLGDRVVRYGFAESREEYSAWVRSCDVVVSCARNEFFGISMAEAVLAGCRPIAPERLVYPDIFPPEAWGEFLYKDENGLIGLLRRASMDLNALRADPHYTFYHPMVADRVVPQFDEELRRVADAHVAGEDRC